MVWDTQDWTQMVLSRSGTRQKAKRDIGPWTKKTLECLHWHMEGRGGCMLVLRMLYWVLTDSSCQPEKDGNKIWQCFYIQQSLPSLQSVFVFSKAKIARNRWHIQNSWLEWVEWRDCLQRCGLMGRIPPVCLFVSLYHLLPVILRWPWGGRWLAYINHFPWALPPVEDRQQWVLGRRSEKQATKELPPMSASLTA